MRRTFSTRQRRQKHFRQKTLSNVALFLVALVPIYPAFGSYMQSYTGVVVRGEYDRSTILASYDWESGESTSDFIEELVNTPPETTLIAPESLAVQPQEPLPSQKTAPEQPKDPKRQLYVTHTVARGDTLGSIAQKYDIPVATLRTMNGLDTDILSINQKITIPRINGVQYVIQKGDTLSVIAQKYGVKDVNSILLANDMNRGSTLTVGRKLLLPNPTKDPTKKPAAQVALTKEDKKTAPKTAPAAESPKLASVTPPKKEAPKKEAKKEAPKDPPIITYGDYSLSLKITK